MPFVFDFNNISKVVKEMSLKQMLFKCCLICMLVNIYFIKLFAQELRFSQKRLENCIFHNDFIILESTESHFPELFVSIRNLRMAPS